jgi:hypothetical protein
MDANKLEKDIINAIETSGSIYLTRDGNTFYGEIYADYRDEMQDKTAIEILESKYPMETFYDKMFEWYMDTDVDYKDEIEKDVRSFLEDNTYPEGLDDEQEEFLHDWVSENVYFNYPDDHYLKQDFYVNIMMDTGDGNYDYTLNAHYPCWYGGRRGEAMDDKASLVWLAKQQGYTKGQLRKTLDNGDMADPKGFLESVRVEVANMASHMQTLTFLVKMDLETLMKINRMLQIREESGRRYDATKYPYSGYIMLDKSVMCGLFDPWQGGGSVFEIQLEKDVKIPVKYIRSCLPDGGDGYSIGSVYGVCGSVWRDVLKEVHVPEKMRGRVVA